MFQSLYRIQQHPDRQLGEAVLNGKGAILMVLLALLEEFIAVGVGIMLDYMNEYLGTNYGTVELNLFTDLAMIGLLIFFFGRFFWINLRNFFKEFKPVYIAAPILCFLGARVVETIINLILVMIRGSVEQTTNNQTVISLLGQRPITFGFLVVVAAPIIEESIYRAGLCRSLTVSKNYFVKTLGFVLSTFLFAFVHVAQYTFSVVPDEVTGALRLVCDYNELLYIVNYIPMAIAFAICSYVCKNFWGSVLCHAITNGMVVFLLMLLSLLKNYLV